MEYNYKQVTSRFIVLETINYEVIQDVTSDLIPSELIFVNIRDVY